MTKTITIKLIKASPKAGPFIITDQFGKVIATDVPIITLKMGVSYIVDTKVNLVTITSIGDCKSSKTLKVSTVDVVQLAGIKFKETKIACLWKHLTDIKHYNYFYGVTEPYIIEYPFFSNPQDMITQSVKDYSKVYKYFPDGTGVFFSAGKIELDNEYFNNLIVYNGQQSSGVLGLAPKPLHNMKEYMKYPIYNKDSKTILYTKSDNFYQINGFYDIVKDKSVPLFVSSCESLSIDKQVNQSNMEYQNRSFRKPEIRAKECKVRYILDNRSDIHIVSQFILTSNQISYK